MELKETVDMMNSSDYKERFRAEYMQTSIRYDKLSRMVERYENGTLDFTPTCPIDLLKSQLKHMREYLACLLVRAKCEQITL